MKNVLIFILVYMTSYAASSNEELVIKEGQRLTIRDLKQLSNETYEKRYKKLILNENSSLLLPNHLRGVKVNLIIDHLEVYGKAYIGQVVTNKFEALNFQFLSFNQYLNNLNGRAEKGDDGAVIHPGTAENGAGDNGIRGNDGKDGKKGRNTVSLLNVDMNIKHLGKLEIILVAESGGNGGKGSAGQEGSDASCSRNAAANGGDGGRGGAGGLPGNVGSINISWQSDYPLVTTGNQPVDLSIKQIPGSVGGPGDGGNGGLGGSGIECLLYSRGIGGNGNHGDFGRSRRGENEYFFLGNKGKVNFFNKDEVNE
jgi:hypothetical protein